MLETMSTKRFHEDDHRLGIKDTVSYSKTLDKSYIGLSSHTRLNYRQSKMRQDVVSESGVSNIKSARSNMSKLSDSRNQGIRSA